MPKKVNQSGITDPKVPSNPPASQHGGLMFPWEEKLRGQSRSGKFVLPRPHFSQPTNAAATNDSGQRLTPDYNMETKEGALKFEHDKGLGKI
jgi:hypothetical protein